jgi:hypothetical protein
MPLWAAMVGAACLAAGAALPEPRDPNAPRVLPCRAASVSLQTSLDLKDAEPRLQHRVFVRLEGLGNEFVVLDAAVTEAWDDTERNLIVESKRGGEKRREQIEQLFRHLDKTSRQGHRAAGILTHLPAKVERVRGEVRGVRAGRLVVKDVPPIAMPTPIEITPGVTFQWIKGRTDHNFTIMEYQVRVERRQGRDGPSLEPVYAGIEAVDKEGRPVRLPFNERRAERDDAYVYTTMRFSIPHQMMERVAHWNVRVYDQLSEVRCGFECNGIETVTP